MIEINRHILQNGLKLVHSRDESTQMVALNIIYNVGSRDDRAGERFTETLPARRLVNIFLGLKQSAGPAAFVMRTSVLI